MLQSIKSLTNFVSIKLSNGLLLALGMSISITGCVSMKLSKLDEYYTPIPATNKSLDIPRYGGEHRLNGHPYVFWHFCKQKQNQLGLVSPETAKDSLIFRMWVTNQHKRKGQPHGLVEIKKDSIGWNGRLILMYVDFKLGTLTETITDFKIIDLSPLKTDWNTVVGELTKLKIAELPTDDIIPGYNDNNGGYNNNLPTFSFEYATREIYRFYQYNNIDGFVDRFWQHKNVADIFELLEEEFQWDTQAMEYFY